MTNAPRFPQAPCFPQVPVPRQVPKAPPAPEAPVFSEEKSFDAYGLPRTDEFCDLDIHCGDQVFKAHKIVVCQRSTIFKAALTGGWTETMDNAYRIRDANPAIVDCMLDFLYSGSYDPEKALNAVTIGRARGPITPAVVRALHVHLEMNAVGNFYDVDQLQETSAREIRRLLTDFWSTISPWYSDFLEDAFRKTGDVSLHLLLVEVTSSNLDELYGSVFGGGANLEVPAWFCSTVLEKSQASVVSMREVLGTADQMWTNLTGRLEAMLRERGY